MKTHIFGNDLPGVSITLIKEKVSTPNQGEWLGWMKK